MVRYSMGVLIIVLLVALCGVSALAGNATMVEIDGVIIDAANPYWKNVGSATASDWNAYFDTSTQTPTLVLNNAYVDTLSSFEELIYSDGDIVVKLLGNNCLSYQGTTALRPAGMVIEGELTIRDGTTDGSGSLEILMNTTAPYDAVFGIYTYKDVVIESGNVYIYDLVAYDAYGIWTEVGQSVLVHGGTLQIDIEGMVATGIETNVFQIANGLVDVECVGYAPFSTAIVFADALITGGEARFTMKQAGLGLVWADPDFGSFRLLDGRLVVSSPDEALYFDTNTVVLPYFNGDVLVSTQADGTGKQVWSDALGILAGNVSDTTTFRYVEWNGAGVTIPQTRDESSLYLWICIGFGALALLVFYYRWRMRMNCA